MSDAPDRDAAELLRQDPAGVFEFMDDPTQARYLEALAGLAREGRRAEAEIALKVLETARGAAEPAARHVGFHLIGPGVAAFRSNLGLRGGWRVRFRAILDRRPATVYLSLVALVGLPVAGLVIAYAAAQGAGPVTLALVAVLTGFLILEQAVVPARLLLLALLPPRLLPRLAFRVLPDAYRTLVVVPTLLNGPEDAREQLRRLERLARVHADRNLRFALLADFLDAPQADAPGDEELRAALAEAVTGLNARQRDATGDKFFVLLRERRWSASERTWMGWERKRGKLEELGRLLRDGGAVTTFRWIFGDFAGACVARRVRYVVTLDDGSWLPQGHLRDLVRTAAHPLNQPCYDPAAGRVVRGYGLLQPSFVSVPRQGPRLPAGAPLYARLMVGWLQAGPPAGPAAPVAPAEPAPAAEPEYPRDFEFDTFGASRYVGKGLYDVDVFRAALEGTFAEASVLSHDHLEGYLLRTAAVYGLVMLEIPPVRYITSRVQMHRWIRGDCQALAWVLPRVRDAAGRRRRNPLPAGARLALLHTQAAHLRGAVVMLTLLLGWVAWPGSPAVWTVVAPGLMLLSPAARLARTLVRSLALLRPFRRRTPGEAARLWRRCINALLRTGFDLALLADHAWLAAGATLRTLWRLLVSRRRLLEWNTHRQAERSTGDSLGFYLRRMAPSAAWGLFVLALVTTLRPEHLPWAAPWALAWAAAPFVCWRLDRP